jgi:SAM-dependent methyltransferase
LYDIFEHLPKLHTIKEIYRCLVPGGWVLSMTPSADGNGYAMDPTHISPYVKQSFWYYTKPQFAKYIGTPVRFQEHRLERIFPSTWHERENIPYVVWDAVSMKDGYDGPGPHEW